MDLPQTDLFTRADALAFGLTDDDLRRLRRTGELSVLRPGFYVSTASIESASPTQRHSLLARSYLMSAPPDHVLSHVSAAIAWDFDIWQLPLDKVHMTHGLDYASKRRPLRILHGTALEPSERATINGYPVTSAARTVVDIARTTTVERSVCVGDSALRSGHTDTDALSAAVETARFRTGISAARRAVSLMTGRSESVGESRSRMLFETLPLPTPLLNQWVYDGAGRFVGRVDFLFWEFKVIGEFDGESKYDSKRVLLDEKYREDRLRQLGWVIVRWNWRDLDDPQALLRRFEQAFARAAGLPTPAGWFGDQRLSTDQLPSFG
ncbi:type IV toxin-antitoxin system AbiEi family antitoxin domain-containing protein [Rhodococcus sp. 14-1411-2a]|uniref:type IV toxin-antitoxin system AbiEi family antitoxin domain-containing protein n=1 Tax=Rhodococcus sp. 14-1411-2a TaxID=2023151 RepID=UPI000B9AAE12|nr:type IV toxin-antitoxin system AbiEi family antitoxin domain-containing protein [Rhodococcus sp. 14-1411-2a]OZF52787.1 hypothetical protein CH291_03200 [Rhodococcus sp. 14-1411-2a]